MNVGDLLFFLSIDCRDETVNLCECKFSTDAYAISQDYAERLNSRKESFRALTGTRKSLHTTMVTTYGLKRNKYSDVVQREVTIEFTNKKLALLIVDE